MKYITTGLFLLLSGLLAGVELPQQGLAGKAAPVVQVRLEYIEVSHETCTWLMFLQSPQNSDATVMRKTLGEMVTRNEAKVVETMLLSCQSGSRSTVESVRELIYPCEYPGGWVCGPPLPEPATDSIFPLMPTAFDTRNCGSMMEIEPSLSADGQSVQLRVVPEVVTHSGNKVVQEGKGPLGNPVTVLMPDFHAARVNVMVDSPVGKHVIAGILSPAGAGGKTDTTRKILVMARCDVVKPD